jgi:hypothetical protein
VARSELPGRMDSKLGSLVLSDMHVYGDWASMGVGVGLGLIRWLVGLIGSGGMGGKGVAALIRAFQLVGFLGSE